MTPLARNIGLFLLMLLVCTAANAQQPEVQSNTAPPPLRIIPVEDRNALSAEGNNIKDRVKKSIELAEVHLTQAENQTNQEQYPEASNELGKYWALIEDLFKFLGPLNRDSTKTRDLYKRVELSLRAQGTRLTIIRRTTPLEYAVWVKELEEFARNGRTEALNSFYGHTVVREPKAAEKAAESQAADKSKSIENKQP
jgi:hypothetical protein